MLKAYYRMDLLEKLRTRLCTQNKSEKLSFSKDKFSEFLLANYYWNKRQILMGQDLNRIFFLTAMTLLESSPCHFPSLQETRPCFYQFLKYSLGQMRRNKELFPLEVMQK